MLGAAIRIQPVVQAVAKGEDVAAGACRGLDDGDVVAAAHQLPGAAQSADAGSRDDHSLDRFGRGSVCGRIAVAASLSASRRVMVVCRRSAPVWAAGS